MKSEEAVIAVVDALERAGVPYMLTGSLATNVYAVPRSAARCLRFSRTTS